MTTTVQGMTEQTDGYNGWSNRETWAVMLYINNDQTLQEQAREVVREALKDEYPNTATEVALRSLCEQYWTVDGYADEFGGDSLPASLSREAEDIGSLWRVNWRECADSIIADLSELDA